VKRREALRVIVSAGALGCATLLGWAAPVASGLRSAAGRGLRAPADLLARIRRRTRPLDSDALTEHHDLAG
jgi:hypothetical protein